MHVRIVQVKETLYYIDYEGQVKCISYYTSDLFFKKFLDPDYSGVETFSIRVLKVQEHIDGTVCYAYKDQQGTRMLDKLEPEHTLMMLQAQ